MLQNRGWPRNPAELRSLTCEANCALEVSKWRILQACEQWSLHHQCLRKHFMAKHSSKHELHKTVNSPMAYSITWKQLPGPKSQIVATDLELKALLMVRDPCPHRWLCTQLPGSEHGWHALEMQAQDSRDWRQPGRKGGTMSILISNLMSWKAHHRQLYHSTHTIGCSAISLSSSGSVAFLCASLEISLALKIWLKGSRGSPDMLRTLAMIRVAGCSPVSINLAPRRSKVHQILVCFAHAPQDSRSGHRLVKSMRYSLKMEDHTASVSRGRFWRFVNFIGNIADFNGWKGNLQRPTLDLASIGLPPSQQKIIRTAWPWERLNSKLLLPIICTQFEQFRNGFHRRQNTLVKRMRDLL